MEVVCGTTPKAFFLSEIHFATYREANASQDCLPENEVTYLIHSEIPLRFRFACEFQNGRFQ